VPLSNRKICKYYAWRIASSVRSTDVFRQH